MKRTQAKWNDQKAKVQQKIKVKNAEKHRRIANYERNKTSSKRRKKAELGYIDAKAQRKNIMKSEIERLKSTESQNK